jgi:hypothetical protein
MEKVLAGDFVREAQEACRQQDWLKVKLGYYSFDVSLVKFVF